MSVFDKLVSRSFLRKYHDTVVRPTQSSVITVSQALSNVVGAVENIEADKLTIPTGSNGQYLGFVDDNNTVGAVAAPPELKNNLTTTESGYALDARQGAYIQDNRESLKQQVMNYSMTLGLLENNIAFVAYMEVESDGSGEVYVRANYDHPNIVSGDIVYVAVCSGMDVERWKCTATQDIAITYQGYKQVFSGETIHDISLNSFSPVQLSNSMLNYTKGVLQDIGLTFVEKTSCSMILSYGELLGLLRDDVATTSKSGMMSASDKAKLDGLGGSSVTGIKGDEESSYRVGNVNLTADNIGALSKTGGSLTGNLIVDRKNGTSSGYGTSTVTIGNGKPQGQEGNSVGTLIIFGYQQHSVNILPTDLTNTRIIWLPDADGVIALKNDIKVTGIKGSAESTYRTGNVNITPANLGIVAASQSVNGLMSSTDKTKLDGIENGAQANTITGIKGDSESSYRVGNVNITPNNIGLGGVLNAKTASLSDQDTSKFTYVTVTIRKDGNVVSIYMAYTIKASLAVNTSYKLGTLPANFRPLISWITAPAVKSYLVSDGVIWIKNDGGVYLYNGVARSTGTEYFTTSFAANWS